MKIYKTKEFEKWLLSQDKSLIIKVQARLWQIEYEDHFGLFKKISSNFFELKWANGTRIYFSYLGDVLIVLLVGGGKDGQSRDIERAKKIKEEITRTKAHVTKK